MVENKNGFLEPSIDDNKCVDCGKCMDVCPVINNKNTNNEKPTIYAFSANDEVLSKSSSGGAFTMISDEILKENGCIIGAEYTEDFRVRHAIVDTVEGLDALRMSKYTQSDQNDCYTRTLELLKSGKKVLYTGTPCQIAGLKNFLGKKDWPNLYTIDLLCHGVPSGKFLREHLQRAYGLDNIDRISMRRGEAWAVCLDIYLKNGKVIKQGGKKSVFMDAFLNDIILRDSCYNCKFASLPRQGDITIGDLWNVKTLALGLPFEKKCSVVLVNNEKGNKLWTNATESSSGVWKDISDTPLTQLNKNIYAPNAKRSGKIDILMDKYQKLPFEEALLQTLHPANVGLILYASNNYGSCATNVALYKAVENLGYAPIVLDNLISPYGLSLEYMKNKLRMSSSFMEKGDYFLPNCLCDSFIIGSDYSLNIKSSYTVNHMEYLLMAFAENKKRKIAYAPSIGMPEVEKYETLRLLYKTLLERFQFVSFREDSAVELSKKYFGIDAQWVLDPVFLVDENVFAEIAGQSSLEFKEPFCLAYILDATPEKKKLIEKISSEMNIKVCVISDLAKYDSNKEVFSDGDLLLEKPSFEDWMAYFIHSSYILTDSFHGTCFSVMFKKPFISIKARNKKRFDALQNLFGFEENSPSHQIFDDTETVLNNETFFVDYDTKLTEEILSESRNKCRDMLEDALQADIQNVRDDSTEMNMQFVRLWRDIRSIKMDARNIKQENKKLIKENKKIKNDSKRLNKNNKLWRRSSILYACFYIYKKCKKLVQSVRTLSTKKEG